MITAIIFSNNSPGSLDLFLQSSETNKITQFKFSVLYNSDELNAQKYLDVIAKHNIESFIKQENFKDNLLSLISNGGELTAFFKDTNYLFSELPSANIEELMSDEDIFCFSLCLGRNIKHCYSNDVYNVLLNEVENGENTIKWNWVKHYLDFGRPLELGGGHIFHKKEIYKLFKKWTYTDILSLEESFDKLDYYPKECMSSFKTSKLVDIMSSQEDVSNNVASFDFTSIDRIVIQI